MPSDDRGPFDCEPFAYQPRPNGPALRANATPLAWRFAIVLDTLVFAASAFCLLGCSSDSFGVPPCRTNRGSVKIHTNIEACPTITSFEVLPSEVSVGSDVSLYSAATVSLGGTPQFMWTATGGDIANPAGANAVFTCTTPGLFALTLTVTNNGCSATANGATVTCATFDTGAADGATAADGPTARDAMAPFESADASATADGP